MTALIDMTGKTFGRLTVLRRVENFGKEVRWQCRCECGTETAAAGSHLRSGHTSSCGCFRDEDMGNRFRTHGQSMTKLHRVLRSMRERCVNSNAPAHKHYGGRGVSICDEWASDATAFIEWAHSHGYKEGLTIDRIDNDGDYCPGNCRFVDRFTQANNKRNNRRHEYNGTSYTLAQLSRMSGLCAETIANRIDVQKLSVEEAVDRPARGK